MEHNPNVNAGKTKRRINEGVIGYLFMIPTIIGFAIFVAYPLVVSIYYSFTNWKGIGKFKHVGWDNFVQMFTKDPSFSKCIRATFEYVLLACPTALILGLFLAVLLNQSLPFIRTFRTIYYIPVIVPSVASIVLWKFIFNPDFGAANAILAALHLPSSQWIQSETMSVPSMALVTLWGVGSTVIILLSGLQSVPVEVYESALLDGAGAWRKFKSITLPMISPILFLQFINAIIASFQEFNLPRILTGNGSSGGGPNFSSYLLAYSIYDNAIQRHYYGYAMAQVLVLFVIILVLTMLIFKFSDAYVYYENDSK